MAALWRLVLGKHDTDGLPLIPQDGELSVDRVAPALARRLALYHDASERVAERLARPHHA